MTLKNSVQQSNEIHVGDKCGCLTIIAEPSDYYENVALQQIQHYQESKQEFLNGTYHDLHPNSNVDDISFFDHWINLYENREFWKVKCKCGKEHYMTARKFVSKKHRFCTELLDKSQYMSKDISILNDSNQCGLRKEQIRKKLAKIEKILENAPRIDNESRKIDYTGKQLESLDIICKYGTVEVHHTYKNPLDDTFEVYDNYKCKCRLCNKEYIFRGDKLVIKAPSQYGYNAYNGYYCEAKCDCHPHSSFQWRTADILSNAGIKYDVEYAFSDLYGIKGINLLRFDFALFSNDTLLCLIECQGEQHYKAFDDFGGEYALIQQKANDELKHQYCKANNIPLIEIPYTINTYDKEQCFLENNEIILKLGLSRRM